MSEDQDSHLNLPELITKQQELIQRLRRQLATAERNVANEAWVRNQLMQSFSWRITSAVRLAARVDFPELPGLIREYRHDFGPPVFEDDALVVFDMTGSCRGNARRE